MPCYYNCPHEYIVRERDLFIPWARVGLSRKGFSILQENDQDARRAKEMAASARRRAVRWSLRLLADRANHQSHRSTLDDEWRTPASEGSGADAEKVLADYSRPKRRYIGEEE